MIFLLFKLAAFIIAAKVTFIALNKIFYYPNPAELFQVLHLSTIELNYLANANTLFIAKTILLLLHFIVWFAWIIFVIYMLYFLMKTLFKSEQCFSQLVEDKKQAESVLTLFKNKCENRKALMIVGKWGSGKTSFYQKSLKPKLREEFKKPIVEISCFGVNNLNDLIVQILNAVIQVEFFAVAANLVKGLLSTSNNFKKLLVPKNLTIIMDNFERYSGSYTELLGFLDFLIQQKSCHILVLCNEEKLFDVQEYKDFSEKIITKYHLELSPEQIEKILGSDSFNFNEHPYTFSKPIVKCFIQIINALKNIRAANDAHIDLIKVSQELISRMKDVDLPQAKKEEYLKNFFGTCVYIVKAVFIKNTNVEQDYFKYLDEYEKAHKNGEKEKPVIKHHVLKILNDIKLESIAINQQIVCIIDYDPVIKAYLNGNIDAFDDAFYNGIIELYIRDNINQEIKNYIKDANNKESIKAAFFAYFKFILKERYLIHASNNTLTAFLLFKLFLLKADFTENLLNIDEQGAIRDLETELNDKIVDSIKSMLEKNMAPNDIFFALDPNFSLLKKLALEYNIGVAS
jgi:hypothetical protein